MGQTKDFLGVTAWTDFKARLTLKESKMQELSLIGGEYTLFFVENTDLYRVSITKTSADGIDYETNFQPTANEKTVTDVNVDNTVNVAITDPGTDFVDYKAHIAISPATTSTHIYSVGTGDTFQIRRIILSGSAKLKATIEIGPTGSETTLGVYYNSTSFPTIEATLTWGALQNQDIKITVENRDNASQDIHTSIIGGIVN